MEKIDVYGADYRYVCGLFEPVHLNLQEMLLRLVLFIMQISTGNLQLDCCTVILALNYFTDMQCHVFTIFQY